MSNYAAVNEAFKLAEQQTRLVRELAQRRELQGRLGRPNEDRNPQVSQSVQKAEHRK